MPLRDLPARKFPLRVEAYSKMYDQLTDAARAFADLGYPELASEMDAVRARLSRAWEAVRAAESTGL